MSTNIKIPKLTADLNIHQNLEDQPTMSASELKEAWDKPVNDIKDYINNTLIKAIDDAIERMDSYGDTLDNKIKDKLKVIYHVGKIITTSVEMNPATYLGFGTWELTGKGRVEIGVDPANANFDKGGKTGGANAIKLTASQIPSISFTGLTGVTKDVEGNFDYSEGPASFTRTAIRSLKNNTGTIRYTNNAQQKVDVTPSYETVYRYKRVS